MPDLRERLLSEEAIQAAAIAVHDESARHIGCPVPWEMHDPAFRQRTLKQARLAIETALETAGA